jgi:hypothetical protein
MIDATTGAKIGELVEEAKAVAGDIIGSEDAMTAHHLQLQLYEYLDAISFLASSGLRVVP